MICTASTSYKVFAQMRWFRMSYDEAQLLVSTGAATVYCYKGQYPSA
jgi:hypothetical protein